MPNRTLFRLTVASIAVVLASVAAAPSAGADHGMGHNGETMELSKSEGLVDGEVVNVTLASWLPGKTITVVTCYVFPAAGPADCELSNYGEHVTTVADDGTVTLEYPVAIVAGRCDHTISCFVVAADGFGANANYAAQEFIFAAPAEPEPAPAEETETAPAEDVAEEAEAAPAEDVAEETEAAPAEDMAEETEAAPAEDMAEETEVAPAEGTDPEPAPEPEPEPAAEPEPAPEPEPEPAQAPEAAAAPADDDSGGSAASWLVPVIIVVAVLAVVAGMILRRRSAS